MNRPPLRKLALAAILAAVAMAALHLADDQSQAKPVVRGESASRAAQDWRSPEVSQLWRSRPKPVENKIGNAFGFTSWAPPPPPPPKPVTAPAPKPTAPPLPFTYLGLYQKSASDVVILARGDRVYTVSEGDVIDGIYRVGEIKSGRLDLIYLPLMAHQLLNIGGAS